MDVPLRSFPLQIHINMNPELQKMVDEWLRLDPDPKTKEEV